MSEWDHLDIAELQVKLKDAPTYQERSAIRKVLHKKQLRGGGGKNIGKAAASGATVKRRPSRESRSIGVVRDFVRKGSDVTDPERCSPDVKYAPSGARESVDNTSSARSTPDTDAERNTPTENGQDNGVEISQLDAAAEADKARVEVDTQPEPAPTVRSEPEKADVETVSPEPQSKMTPEQPKAAPEAQRDDLDEVLTESALESAIARSSDYNQRRDLRTRLRKLRSDNRAGRNVRSRASENSESDGNRERQPAPSSAESPTPQATEVVATSPEPIESEQPESEMAANPEETAREDDQSNMDVVKALVEVDASTTEPTDNIDIVVEDVGDDGGENEQEANRRYSLEEDKILRKSATEPVNSYDKTSGLAGDEGVSDFRTVLRRSPSPALAKQSTSKTDATAAQLDFRNLLQKRDGGVSPKKTLEAGEHQYRAMQARQEDFRGQLKRKVETKDCSSAAPKRTGASRQEDFRGLLKKPDEEGGRSPRNSLTPATTPPATTTPASLTSPQQSVDGDTSLAEDTEVASATLSTEHIPPGKSPVPPPVKAKPKVSPRPSPVPPEMRDGLATEEADEVLERREDLADDNGDEKDNGGIPDVVDGNDAGD